MYEFTEPSSVIPLFLRSIKEKSSMFPEWVGNNMNGTGKPTSGSGQTRHAGSSPELAIRKHFSIPVFAQYYIAGTGKHVSHQNLLFHLIKQDVDSGKQVLVIDNIGTLRPIVANAVSKDKIRYTMFFDSSFQDRYFALSLMAVHDEDFNMAFQYFVRFLKRYLHDEILTEKFLEHLETMFHIVARYDPDKLWMRIFRLLYDHEYAEDHFKPLMPLFKTFLATIPEDVKLSARKLERMFQDSCLPVLATHTKHDAFSFSDPRRHITFLELKRNHNRFEDEFLFYTIMIKLASYLSHRSKDSPSFSLYIHDGRGMLNFLPDFSEHVKKIDRLVISDVNEENLQYLPPLKNHAAVVFRPHPRRHGQVHDISKISLEGLQAITENDYLAYNVNIGNIPHLDTHPSVAEKKASILFDYSYLTYARKSVFVELEIGVELFMDEKWKVNHERSAWITLEPDYRVNPADPLFHSRCVPRQEGKPDLRTLLLNAEQFLSERVIGQPEAVNALSRRVRTGALGFKVHEHRPNGVYFFLGPTGVGKTELAKALAELLFGDENALIRFDMSEFYDRHTVANLIGSPRGYVGHEEGGLLINKIIEKPKSVILFDEVEKAYRTVFQVFLQMIDEGRLTDGKGRTGDFSKSYIIFTSNLGHELLSANIGFMQVGKKAEQIDNNEILSVLEKRFSPEFVGRMDQCIYFRHLDENDLMKICKLKMEKTKRILEKQGVQLKYDIAVLKKILEEASKVDNKGFVTRRIQKMIFHLILEPLASIVLEDQKKKKVRVMVKNGKIIFNFSM